MYVSIVSMNLNMYNMNSTIAILVLNLIFVAHYRIILKLATQDTRYLNIISGHEKTNSIQFLIAIRTLENWSWQFIIVSFR